jgi:hypothetical protein
MSYQTLYSSYVIVHIIIWLNVIIFLADILYSFIVEN